MCYEANEGVLTNYLSCMLGEDDERVAIRAVKFNCLSVTGARYFLKLVSYFLLSARTSFSFILLHLLLDPHFCAISLQHFSLSNITKPYCH